MPEKRLIPALLLLLCCTGQGMGQIDSLKQARIDSLTIKLQLDSLKIFRFKKLRPYANLDNRNSFITKRPVNIQGIQVGIVVNEHHIFGIGFYTISQQSQKAQKIQDNTRTVNQSLTLSYNTVFYQFVLLDKRYLELDLPFELGFGHYTEKLQDIDTQKTYRTHTAAMVPMGAGVQVVLKPVRWVGFSAAGGYRYVIEKSSTLNFNGLYYSFGLMLDVRQIYRDVKYYGVKRRKYRKEVKEILLN